MKEYILEACVDSVESAMAAVEGGADRLELCGNLIIGGTTPGPWLFDEIRKRSDIRIHALIRPRFGDFCYTRHEIDILCQDIRTFRKLGADKACSGRFQENGCRRCCIWGAEAGWHIKHGTDERADGGGRGYVGDSSQSF